MSHYSSVLTTGDYYGCNLLVFDAGFDQAKAFACSQFPIKPDPPMGGSGDNGPRFAYFRGLYQRYNDYYIRFKDMIEDEAVAEILGKIDEMIKQKKKSSDISGIANPNRILQGESKLWTDIFMKLYKYMDVWLTQRLGDHEFENSHDEFLIQENAKLLTKTLAPGKGLNVIAIFVRDGLARKTNKEVFVRFVCNNYDLLHKATKLENETAIKFEEKFSKLWALYGSSNRTNQTKYFDLQTKLEKDKRIKDIIPAVIKDRVVKKTSPSVAGKTNDSKKLNADTGEMDILRETREDPMILHKKKLYCEPIFIIKDDIIYYKDEPLEIELDELITKIDNRENFTTDQSKKFVGMGTYTKCAFYKNQIICPINYHAEISAAIDIRAANESPYSMTRKQLIDFYYNKSDNNCKLIHITYKSKVLHIFVATRDIEMGEELYQEYIDLYMHVGDMNKPMAKVNIGAPPLEFLRKYEPNMRNPSDVVIYNAMLNVL